MQKIIPFLWFDHQAEEAVAFYTAIFENSSTGDISRYDEASAKVSGRAEGSVMTIEFQLAGQEFGALNGGPIFKFTPAISFVVNCETAEKTEALWEKLLEKGTVLMKLGAYPFSEKFGWLQDQYGVSWQLNFADRPQKIAPCLMFAGQQHGKAEEAINLYTSLFKDSAILKIDRYAEGEEELAGTMKHALFSLAGQKFSAMDSGRDHAFTFTNAISFLVNCGTQTEVDTLWEQFSTGGEIEECGWLKDRYGVSWQIVPTVLNELLHDSDANKSQNVMKAMLQMKKLDIEGLQRAYAQV